MTSHAIAAGEQFSLVWDAANIDNRASSNECRKLLQLVYQPDGGSVTTIASTDDYATWQAVPSHVEHLWQRRERELHCTGWRGVHWATYWG